MIRNFADLLANCWKERKFVCVGLDSDVSRIPRVGALANLEGGQLQLAFNRAIIDATAEVAGAYKPNAAFYEALGPEGLEALEATVAYINERAPRVPVIFDAKRADIGNTNEGYATHAFDRLGADALTVHPYLGQEALKPLLDRADKGIVVLARTSNPGAGELQDLLVEGIPLYAHVARRVAREWNYNGNCGLVAGATYAQELATIRELAPELALLIPGIGAQGGDLEATVRSARDEHGAGMIINSSRGVIFASKGEDFAEAARLATVALHNQIVHALDAGE